MRAAIRIGLGLGVVLSLALASGPSAAWAGPLEEALAARLERGLGAAETEDQAAALAELGRVYRARGLAPLWVGEGGLGARGEKLARLLAEANLDGLDPKDYGAPAIHALLGSSDTDRLAELELRLSLGLALFASDLGQGRTAPHVADPKLYIFRAKVDPASVLRSAAEAEDLAALVETYRPQNPRYGRLKRALADYRALAERGGWEPIAKGPLLKPGERDPRVPLLRARLALWGDLEAAATPVAGDLELYDEALVKAVERMQWRHGLDTDGVVGPATLRALNVSAEARVAQIVLNLERRRWLPDDMGQRFIFVNLADFALKLVDEPKTLLDMRVVVGKPYHMTPIFSAEMSYLVINPFWNVPPSIARREILPKLRKNASYLTENKFKLFSDWSNGAKVVDPATIDWALAPDKSFPYKVRQEPGDHNALGRIKFMFPNRFNVYLHDTPAKSLFKRATRSFSHGCIRVADPVRLAEAILGQNPGWAREKIEDTIAKDERRVVSLARPLPVHIGYLTAYANKDGSVHFRDDVYGRDARLRKALFGPRGRPTLN